MKALAAVALLSAPALALACPSCARDGSPITAYLVGSMILLPFAVASVVIRAIRRGDPETHR